MDLAAAQHAVSATMLWHLRVLAGWVPPYASGPLRVLAAGFEIAGCAPRWPPPTRPSHLLPARTARLPFLGEPLHRLELRLDELEREERTLTHWATRRRGGGAGGSPGSPGGRP
jgi:hypothetical protein